MVIVEFAKAAKEKKKGKKSDVSIYSSGYHSLGGIVAGALISYLWDKSGMPGQDEKIKKALLTGKPLRNSKDITMAKTIVLTISVGLMMSELLGIKGGMASGSGLMIGYTIADNYRQHKYIGQV
jgi:hypothetical protein